MEQVPTADWLQTYGVTRQLARSLELGLLEEGDGAAGAALTAGRGSDLVPSLAAR